MYLFKKILFILPEFMRDFYLDNKYDKQLEKWKAGGCKLPVPHAVKQITIKSYQNTHDVDTLIETGTYLGDMTYAQRKLFRRIYTIELSEALYKMAVDRLRKYKNIELLLGDSGIVLNSLIGKIDGKSIFWLDGHYSGGITAKGSKECPVMQELDIILNSPYEHIILIDDAREFNGTNDYPLLEELDSVIRESKFPNSVIYVKDDIIRIELKS